MVGRAPDMEKPRGFSSVRPRGPRLRPQPGVLCAGPAAGGAAALFYRGAWSARSQGGGGGGGAAWDAISVLVF
jgi:hypothetical protein